MSGKDKNNPTFGVLKAALCDERQEERGALPTDFGTTAGIAEENG